MIANSKLRNNVESWYPPGNPIGRNNVVRNNCVKGGAYDDGDGGIGDQIGFKVVGAVRTRPSYNSRSGRGLPARRGQRLPRRARRLPQRYAGPRGRERRAAHSRLRRAARL